MIHSLFHSRHRDNHARGPWIAGLGLCALFITGCNSAPAPTKTIDTKPLSIVVSGDTRGWLAPCGCTSNQSGGLLRRATYIADLAKTNDTLVCDAGGAVAGASTYDRLRFAAILDAEAAIGVAAHNLGESELAQGPKALREMNEQRQTFVSANTTDLTGEPLASPKRVVTKGDAEVTIIGVVSPTFATSEIRVSDPADAILRNLPPGSKNKNAISLVLAWLPEAELRALAAQLPEVDFMIGGPTGQAIAPGKVGDTWTAAASNKGKFLITMTRDRNVWQGEVVEMNTRFADAPAIQSIVDQFRNTLEAKDLPATETSFVPALARELPAGLTIAGSAACERCHPADTALWKDSKHGHAWATLTTTRAQFDSSCQQCHTTGFGFPGGFVSAKQSLERINVGCENCHGPSSEHVRNPRIRTPLKAANQCVTCHDPENSPKFDYATYWARIRHGSPAAKEPTP